MVENLDNPEEQQHSSNTTHKNNDSGININDKNSFVKCDTNRSCSNQLDGFSPHTISTPVSDSKFEGKIIKDEQNTYPEQRKLDLKNIEDAVAKIDLADENCNDNKPKTSDYDSLSNSIVDNLLNKLSQDSELCDNQKTDNNIIQEPKSSSCKKADISDLVFEDCKKTLDEKDKGNVSKISPGQYYGQARHKDGSMLPIIFEVSFN